MRNRPTQAEQKFIEGATAKDSLTVQKKSEDLHKYVKRIIWPIDDRLINPSLGEGSNLRKNLTVSLTEQEWNSIDRHTKALRINKTEWVRYALFKLMQEEQLYCFQNK